uniref:Uncharacterized protein n=1 Tax=Rhizophora mucronata TaxID=61149 RepID=A0A2P2P6H0_RHIMU
MSAGKCRWIIITQQLQVLKCQLAEVVNEKKKACCRFLMAQKIYSRGCKERCFVHRQGMMSPL